LSPEPGAENLTYYEYDAANELTALHGKDGWTYFAYDENGNTVAEQTPAHTRYYDWDGRDMMVGVRSTEQGWTDKEYRYDGMASRVSTLESTGLTYYDWDGINVLQEKDAAGQVAERQVHGYAPIVSVGDIVLIEKLGG
jgi:YD repeat-containing protein